MSQTSFSAFLKGLFCVVLLLSVLAFVGCSSKDDQPVNAETQETAAPAPVPQQQPEANIAHKKTQKEIAPPVSDINKPAAQSQLPSKFATEVLAKFNAAGSSSLKIELLESLSDLSFIQDPNVIAVVQKAVSDPNAGVSQAAISLLNGYDSPEILPAVAEALKSNDEQTRLDAMGILSDIDDPNVGKLVLFALDDLSEDVRDSAMDIAFQQAGEAVTAIMRQGIVSEFSNVKEAAVSMLQDKADREAVDILITGLKDKDPDFREGVSSALELLIDQKFDKYEQAKKWWAQNRDKYDDDLMPQDEDEEEE